MNVFGLRTSLGRVGYYRIFLEGFSRISYPITKLICNSNKFEWTEQCENSFQEPKKGQLFEQILEIPKRAKGFAIYGNAPWKGMEYVLMQKRMVTAYTLW